MINTHYNINKYGNCWFFPQLFGKCWQLLANVGNFWQMMATFGKTSADHASNWIEVQYQEISTWMLGIEAAQYAPFPPCFWLFSTVSFYFSPLCLFNFLHCVFLLFSTEHFQIRTVHICLQPGWSVGKLLLSHLYLLPWKANYMEMDIEMLTQLICISDIFLICISVYTKGHM